MDGSRNCDENKPVSVPTDLVSTDIIVIQRLSLSQSLLVRHHHRISQKTSSVVRQTDRFTAIRIKRVPATLNGSSLHLVRPA